jgi:hypothetical protein
VAADPSCRALPGPGQHNLTRRGPAAFQPLGRQRDRLRGWRASWLTVVRSTFFTHNPHHAYPIGDRFLLLNRGRALGYNEKSQITRDELTCLMAGGAELEQLSHELESVDGAAAVVGYAIEEEAEELGIAQRPGQRHRSPESP